MSAFDKLKTPGLLALATKVVIITKYVTDMYQCLIVI